MRILGKLGLWKNLCRKSGPCMHETPSNWHISPNCLQNISNIYKFNWHFPPNLPAKKSGLNLPGPNLPRTFYHIVYLCICSYICVQRITLKHCQSASHLTLLSSITIRATINFYEPKYYQLRWELFKFWCATTGAQPATSFLSISLRPRHSNHSSHRMLQ